MGKPWKELQVMAKIRWALHDIAESMLLWTLNGKEK